MRNLKKPLFKQKNLESILERVPSVCRISSLESSSSEKLHSENKNSFSSYSKCLLSFYKKSSKHINYKIGTLFGLFSGSVVYYINSNHGFWQAVGGFNKQFLYNVFIAGYNIRLCEKLARRISSKTLSTISTTVIPTLSAFLTTYGIHKLSGTPEAFKSSIWQVYLNFPIFFGMGQYYRKKYHNSEKDFIQD